MIYTNSISYSYPGGPPVLRNVSFHIAKGERVGLIGANGAGKSTLLKALLGLLAVTGGAAAAAGTAGKNAASGAVKETAGNRSAAAPIVIGGLAMTPANLPAIRKMLGYVLQDSDDQMFMPTVLEDMIFGPMNYGMSRAEAEAKADEVLAELGFSYLKLKHNHRISGGEKRMAAIATILAMEPDVLIMDEPSSSLDPKNRRRLIDTLNRLPQTKVIASHDLDMILDTCDRAIVITDGEIRADGPAEDILRDKDLLEANDLELPLSLSR